MHDTDASLRHAAAAADLAIRAIVAPTTEPQRWYHLDHAQLALRFRADTPFAAWEHETRALLDVARGIQWLVGDALAFGEDQWGEQAAQIFDFEEYSFDAVEKMIRTAKAIPPERRRATVGYSVHAEVASLPPPQQEALLEHAQATQATVAEVRQLARATRRRLAREEAAQRPVPALAIPNLILLVADARTMPLPDACVDLIVTSPPYGIAVDYLQGDIAPQEWDFFMDQWLEEAYRVIKPHGRLALNIPLDTAKGGVRPTYANAVMAALSGGWDYHSTIVWHDASTTKGNRALGSIDSAARPYHVSQVEMIGLFSKGEWGPSSANPDDITPEEWQAAGRGPWAFPGETHPWEGFPAAFPVELPRRLVRYLSRVGDHVLDPFLGSGTTAVAAISTGRRFTGLDCDGEAINSTQRRLAVIGQEGS
jgi:site-specific DNA-methyltransferase (adenine-specific)